MTLNKKLKWLIGISSIAIISSIAPILVSCSESDNNTNDNNENNNDQNQSDSTNNDYINPMPDNLDTFDAEFEWLWSTTFFPGFDNYFQDKTHIDFGLAQLVPTNIPWQESGVVVNNWYNKWTDLNTLYDCVEKEKNKVKKYVQDCTVIGDNYFDMWNGKGELITYYCSNSPCYGWYEIHEGHLDGKYDLIRWTRRV